MELNKTSLFQEISSSIKQHFVFLPFIFSCFYICFNAGGLGWDSKVLLSFSILFPILFLKGQIKTTNPLYCLLLFIIISLLSAIFGIDKLYSLGNPLLLMALFFGCFFINSRPQRERDKTIIYLVIINIVFGLFLFYFTSHLRFAGVFQSVSDLSMYYPNAYALFFLGTFPLVYNYRKDNLFSVFLGVYLSTFFLTFSRAAILVFIIGVVFLFFLLLIKKIKINFKKLLGVFCISIMSFLFLNTAHFHINNNQETFIKKIHFQSDEKKASINERVFFWGIALEEIKRNASLFGIGDRGFARVLPKHQTDPLVFSVHPHNLSLKILLENGVLAFALYISFIFYLVYLFSRTPREDMGDILPLLFACLLILGHEQLDGNLGFSLNSLLFTYIVFNILLNRGKSSKPNMTNIKIMAAILLLLFSYEITLLSMNKLARKAENLSPSKAHKLYSSIIKSAYPRDTYISLINTSDNNIDKEKYIKAAIKKSPQNDQYYFLLSSLENKEDNLQKCNQLNPYNQVNCHFTLSNFNPNYKLPSSFWEKWEDAFNNNRHYAITHEVAQDFLDYQNKKIKSLGKIKNIIKREIIKFK